MINIICALDCEARVFIDFYKLKRVREHSLAIYENQVMRVLVSGIGHLAAATACAYAAALSAKASVYINIGSAGGKDFSIGDCFLIDKISSEIFVDDFYPVISFSTGSRRAMLKSMDMPNAAYVAGGLQDMEAYGFYAAARQFTTLELIQCIKVVSDTQANERDGLSKQFLQELLLSSFSEIRKIIQSLQQLCAEYEIQISEPQYLSLMLNQFKFSEAQKQQLKRLLRGMNSQKKLSPILLEQLSGCGKANDVLMVLAQKLADQVLQLGQFDD